MPNFLLMKFRPWVLIWSAVLLFSDPSFSQAICGFDQIYNSKMQSDPGFRKRMETHEAALQRTIFKLRNAPPKRGIAALFTIPVVVHIVHTGGAQGTIYNPTDAQIQTTIDYLNQVYDGSYPGTEGVGDLQIQFVLAQRDPNCNPTSGIDRVDGSAVAGYTANGVNVSNTNGADQLDIKNLIRWDPFRYYNIWVVNKIDGLDGTSGTFVAGFALTPGAPPELDGTVMLATQMGTGKKTLPHEIGHAFDLLHPFQGSSGTTCPPNAECTVDGDKICDTDPITQPAAFVCRTGVNPCTGGAYSINTEHNFMNYTNCTTLFTADQKIRMLASAESIERVGLTTSRGAAATYPLNPFVAPIAASCSPVTGATGLSNNYAGILNITLAGQNNNSSTAALDHGYVDGTGCINLLQLQKGTSYGLTLILLGANREQIRVWIDYDNDGAFDNAAEQILYVNNIPSAVSGFDTVTTSFTVPSTAVENVALRLRLTEELSTIYDPSFAISSACYNPTYGQAEDYPLYISAAALPVVLEYFRGSYLANASRLQWKSASELNLEKYEVESSADGQSFSVIGTVAAENNSNGGIYNYTDRQSFTGNKFYRLKMIDKDGAYKYSQIVVLQNNGQADMGTWVLNPFHDYLDISIGRTSRQNIRLNLFDATGKLILKKNLPPDQDKFHIDLSSRNLSNGVYILDMEIEGVHEIRKIVRQ